MGLTYRYPSCRSEAGAVGACAACGADSRDLAGETHEQQLIRALHHRKPTVPILAATLLGELGSRAAVEPLIEIAVSSADPYIQEAAIVALGRMRDPRALPCLDRLRREGLTPVRTAAHRATKALRRAGAKRKCEGDVRGAHDDRDIRKGRAPAYRA